MLRPPAYVSGCSVSLGTSYHRNISQQPNLNHGSHDRDHPFFNVYFDMRGDAGGSGYAYDLAFSTLLGAQINSPRFNSSGEYKAFGACICSTEFPAT